MTEQSAPCRDGAAAFTLRSAAAELGISLNTLRRRIASGQIAAERIHRPQGHVWAVYLHPPGTQEHRADGTVPRDGATVHSAPAPADAMVSLIQTTIATVLGPLVAELAASRQTIERQAEQLVGAAETIGRQSAELEAARATIATLTAPGSPLLASTAATAPDPTTGAPWRSWPRGWIAGAATVLVALVAVVMLLAWLG